MKRKIICLMMISVLILPLVAICFLNNSAYASENSSDLTFDLGWHREMLHQALDINTNYASNIDEYDSFMTSYFDNLTQNLGVNYKDSCGYVSLGMLLSYYDTFLNDRIIPEQYDAVSYGDGINMIRRRNSPGILRDELPEDEQTVLNFSAAEYLKRVESLSEVSLHSKLIMIGNSLGYYNKYSDSSPCMTSYASICDILKEYLENIVNFSSYDYEIASRIVYSQAGSDEVKQFTINKILEGSPVIVGVYSGAGPGHIAVAYDYDATRNSVYCHWGYGADKTHYRPQDSGYNYYAFAISINWYIEHEHSNNYAVYTEQNNPSTAKYYCSCSDEIITHNHTHSFDYYYVEHSLAKHKAYCICGEYVLKYHVGYSMVGGVATTCIYCNAIFPYSANEKDSNNVMYVSANGSYILSNGVTILAPDDVQLYFAGELIFYDKNNYTQLA